MSEPTDRERLTLVERAQETYDRSQRLHADILAQHADAHREHREASREHRDRMAALEANHQVLLDLLAAQEERLTAHREHLARLDVLVQAIKELLERGHNGH